MLFKLFKPKWQSPKSDVRIKAIENADATTNADILSELATRDQSSLVRAAAIAKLTDYALLSSLCDAPDATQRDEAQKRICHLLCETESFDQPQTTLLSCVQQQELLTHIVLNAQCLALQKAALEQVDDATSLATIVRVSNLAVLRRTAATQLNDAELLEQLAKETLSKDKGINRILRSNLARLQQQQAELDEALAQAESLAKQLEQHAKSLEDSATSAAHTQLLRQKLQSHIWIKEAKNAQQRAEAAWQTIDAHCTAIAQAKAEQEHAARVTEEKRQAEQDKAKQLVKDGTALQLALLEKLDAVSQEEAINTLFIAIDSLPATIQKQHSLGVLKSQITELSAAITRLDKHSETISALLSAPEAQLNESELNKEVTKLKKLLATLAWPKDMAEPELIRRLIAQQQQLDNDVKTINQAAHAAQSSINEQLSEIERAIAEGQSKQAEKLIKRAEQQSNVRMTNAQVQQLKNLNTQLNELQDWAGFAAAPKKQALCEKMEALAGSQLPPELLAKEIQALQREWKQVDATDTVHSHTVWKRFKRAADEAYAPCEAYFDDQKSTRTKNLARRQQICDMLAQHLAAFDSETVDWKALAEVLKRAKRNWKDASPVDRSPGKKLQAQFDKLLPQLEEPLKTYRNNNAEDKLALVNEVESLLAGEISADTLEEVKHLQQVWRDIGPTYRNREQQMWPKFRDACNEIFDKYHNQRKASNEQIQQQVQNTERLCHALENAIYTLTGYDQLNTLLAEADALQEPVYNALPNTLEKRFSHTVRLAKAQQQKLLNLQGSSDPDIQRRAILCDKFEITLISDDHQPQQQDDLVSAWQQGSVTSDELQNRFDELLELRHADEEVLVEYIQSQAQKMRQLCICLEIALGQESPANDQAMRMEYQLERLQQALAQQGEVPDLDTVLNIQHAWLGTSFRSHHQALVERFNNLVAKLA